MKASTKKTLPASARVKRSQEIDKLYRRGRRARGRLMRLHVRESDTGRSRLAISVPRRLCGAVQRNRWKRMIREAFRLHQDQFGPVDVLAIPNVPPDGLKRQDVDHALLGLMKRVQK